MMNKPFIGFIAFILALGMMRCGNLESIKNNSMETPEPTSEILLDGEWVLNYMMDAPGNFETIYPKAPELKIENSDGKVSGFSGCNRFTGTVDVNGRNLKWGENFGNTRKMCPNMEAERFFLSSLKKATSYSVSNNGNTLDLIVGDVTLLRFERQ
jgi:heat shock protein HslJ